MKTFLKAVLTLFVFVAFANTASAQKTTLTATIKTAIYCDHCKVCETCGPQLQKGLLKEKGVQMVTLDEEAMTIKVVYNSKKISLPQIRTAISRLGYDADEVKAEEVAYEALDGCCKKS